MMGAICKKAGTARLAVAAIHFPGFKNRARLFLWCLTNCLAAERLTGEEWDEDVVACDPVV